VSGEQGERDAAATADAATGAARADAAASDAALPDAAPRQRIVRVGVSRRAKLTPAPGTTAEPTHAEAMGDAPRPAPGTGDTGPNDAQLRADVPPHY
jgi:hypothetical protein